MKKWVVILTACLGLMTLNGFAEEKETGFSPAEEMETAAAPTPTPTPTPTPAPENNLEPKNPETSPANEVKIEELEKLPEWQNLRSDLELLQQKYRQLHRQIIQIHYTVIGLAGVVILLILLMLIRLRKPSLKMSQAAVPVLTGSEKTIKMEDDTQDEYDFMGSSEGIPAKLDLARAYIAMEDFDAACQTLSEILGEGDESQCQEARALLKQINPS